MDIENLIEQLNREAYGSDIEDLLLEAATALSTLQAKNEKLRAELEQKEKYYEQMVDALAATESAELEQVKRERDAAVEGIREWEKFDTYLRVHSFITPEKWRGQKED